MTARNIPALMDAQATHEDRLFHLMGWAETHKRGLIIGAVVITLAGIGIWIYLERRAQREVDATTAMAQISESPSGSMPKPENADEYLQVARDFPGTKAAERAALVGAGLLFEEKQYEKAQQTFQSFLRDNPASTWRAAASLGVANCLDAQGKTAEAISKYDEVIKRYPNSSVTDEAKLNLARLYTKQDKLADALKLYEELSKAGYTAVGAEAAMYQEELLDKHPELAPKPEEMANLTPPMMLGTNHPALTNLSSTNPSSNATPAVSGAPAQAPETNAGLLEPAVTNLPSLLSTNLSAPTAGPPPASGTNKNSSNP